MATIGYSGKPLAQKLGIKAGHAIRLVNAPADAEAMLGALPEGASVKRGKVLASADVILWFVRARVELESGFVRAHHVLPPGAMLWIAWPKRASGVPTDVTEDTLRAVGLPTGLVDVKVCAISDVWSGLKFMHRTKSG